MLFPSGCFFLKAVINNRGIKMIKKLLLFLIFSAACSGAEMRIYACEGANFNVGLKHILQDNKIILDIEFSGQKIDLSGVGFEETAESINVVAESSIGTLSFSTRKPKGIIQNNKNGCIENQQTISHLIISHEGEEKRHSMVCAVLDLTETFFNNIFNKFP